MCLCIFTHIYMETWYVIHRIKFHQQNAQVSKDSLKPLLYPCSFACRVDSKEGTAWSWFVPAESTESQSSRAERSASWHLVTMLIWDGYMGVSKNYGTPKSSILIRFSIMSHPFWGTPIFGNTHIYIYTRWCQSKFVYPSWLSFFTWVETTN